MLIYCLGKDGREAVTIGALMWLPFGKSLADFREDEARLLAICRPNDETKKAHFDHYVNEMKSHGPVRYVTDAELPGGCVRHKGYWESAGV